MPEGCSHDPLTATVAIPGPGSTVIVCVTSGPTLPLTTELPDSCSCEVPVPVMVPSSWALPKELDMKRPDVPRSIVPVAGWLNTAADVSATLVSSSTRPWLVNVRPCIDVFAVGRNTPEFVLVNDVVAVLVPLIATPCKFVAHTPEFSTVAVPWSRRVELDETVTPFSIRTFAFVTVNEAKFTDDPTEDATRNVLFGPDSVKPVDTNDLVTVRSPGPSSVPFTVRLPTRCGSEATDNVRFPGTTSVPISDPRAPVMTRLPGAVIVSEPEPTRPLTFTEVRDVMAKAPMQATSNGDGTVLLLQVAADSHAPLATALTVQSVPPKFAATAGSEDRINVDVMTKKAVKTGTNASLTRKNFD
jgi:hypothetical protein